MDSTNKTESQSNEQEKDFIDPETTLLVGMGTWWVIKTMLQSIAGWIGIQLFKRAYNKVVGHVWRKNRKESSEEILEEESTAASYRSLRRGCDGGRIHPSESESD